MKSRLLWVVAGVLVLAVAVAGPLFATFSDATEPELKTPPLDAASASVDHFFDVYLRDDGRVASDEGPTVSNEQAYALLLSAATRDRERFDRIWTWTTTHLLQSNGLLAEKWENGAVVAGTRIDEGANIDAARALVVASRQFGDATYLRQARELAGAMKTKDMYGGSMGIAVGDHSPRGEQAMAEITRDDHWSAVGQEQRSFVDTLIGRADEDRRLPPDLALRTDSGVVAAPEARYSEHAAARTSIRLAESCSEEDRIQAARIWTVLNRSRESRFATSFDLNGSVRDDTPATASAIAAAAGAKAAEDELQMYSLLDVGDRLEAENGSAYGAAWVALGRVMLTTNWLGDC